ncbi:MAG: hypothetical protein WAK71_14975 [Streptosporangiaceae bacterium]
MPDTTPRTKARITALEAEHARMRSELERTRSELDALLAVLRAVGAPLPDPQPRLVAVR